VCATFHNVVAFASTFLILQILTTLFLVSWWFGIVINKENIRKQGGVKDE
jgi:hypothetical protein